jgi:DNA mismatch repair protein MutS
MDEQLRAKETPLMRQYNAVKARYPGALLLFRVGDFYETFSDDAVIASKVLDIVLTRRSNGAASEVELAGFPHHALDTYLPRLVRAGHRVAICDQLEDPKNAKGIVRRGVTELVTPGVSFHDQVLEKKSNNYLAALHLQGPDSGLAFLDASTGEFYAASGEVAYLDNLLQHFQPSELLHSKSQRGRLQELFRDHYNTFAVDDWVFGYDTAYEKLIRHFNTSSLKGFGIENMPGGIVAAGAILYYLEETEHRETRHIAGISRLEESQYVWLDKFTIRNLELAHPQQEGGVSLIEALDQTTTPMGARLLKKWVVMPLKELEPIEDRLDGVEAFVTREELRTETGALLRHIGDLERLIGKVAVKRINPREMQQLRRSLQHLTPIREKLAASGAPVLQKLADQINPCVFLLEKISRELKDEVPLLTNQGNMIREGVDPDLDELRKIAYSGKDYLLQIQQREVQRTGISSLKVSYNKVFGYYLEVTHAHREKVPADWIRKQTLVNAERYITEELKVYEEKILTAEEKITAIEFRLFMELVQSAVDFVQPIQLNARVLGTIDCLLSFALTASAWRYVRPRVTDELAIDIKGGRHPVIEQQLPPAEPYVPNDVFLDNESQQIMIITGPNMAGKSALLRQTALIVLMAQMGSFVPAGRAVIGLVDRVFTRVGASDNIARGESTFMVEMTETASILNNLSDRSLVLMDEIGRGTSTYDGISIAWSIVEYLHNHPKYRPKTLFATHYHELNQLANDFPRIRNYNVAVKEAGDRIIFIRTLREGGSEHSFGIHVAQMAGMPNPIVLRANDIMQHLEQEKLSKKSDRKFSEIPKQNYQLSLFEADPRMEQVREMLGKIDINTVSPIEALLKLNEMIGILKGGKG